MNKIISALVITLSFSCLQASQPRCKRQKIAKRSKADILIDVVFLRKFSVLEKASRSTINKQGTYGNTALCAAASTQYLRGVIALLKRGACVDIIGRNGFTSLHQPAFKGYLCIVKELLKKSPDLTLCDSCGWTAFHYAVLDGHVSIVKAFLAAGAKPTVVTPKGNTALHLALWAGHVDVVELFVEYPELWAQKNKDGVTPRNVVQTTKK